MRIHGRSDPTLPTVRVNVMIGGIPIPSGDIQYSVRREQPAQLPPRARVNIESLPSPTPPPVAIDKKFSLRRFMDDMECAQEVPPSPKLAPPNVMTPPVSPAIKRRRLNFAPATPPVTVVFDECDKEFSIRRFIEESHESDPTPTPIANVAPVVEAPNESAPAEVAPPVVSAVEAPNGSLAVEAAPVVNPAPTATPVTPVNNTKRRGRGRPRRRTNSAITPVPKASPVVKVTPTVPAPAPKLSPYVKVTRMESTSVPAQKVSPVVEITPTVPASTPTSTPVRKANVTPNTSRSQQLPTSALDERRSRPPRRAAAGRNNGNVAPSPVSTSAEVNVINVVPEPVESPVVDSASDFESDEDLFEEIKMSELRSPNWTKARAEIKQRGLVQEGEYSVEKILDVKFQDVKLFFVKWAGWSSDFNTWEPEAHMNTLDFEYIHEREQKIRENNDLKAQYFLPQ